MMNIIIQTDGIIAPFNIQSSRETGFTLLSQTRDIVDEKPDADGDFDFGTELKTNSFILQGVIEVFSVDEKIAAENTLRKQLNECRYPQKIMYECMTDRYNFVWLATKPTITRHAQYIEVKADFNADPFWYGSQENIVIGSGVLINNGTIETPLIIEIEGLATDPVVSIGDYTLAYTGSIGFGQTLVIDTDKMTAKIDNTNVIDRFTGDFPKILPCSSINVIASDIGTTKIKWRNRWI